jgi:hypothetical protein
MAAFNFKKPERSKFLDFHHNTWHYIPENSTLYMFDFLGKIWRNHKILPGASTQRYTINFFQNMLSYS